MITKSRFAKATLVSLPPSGITRTDSGEHIGLTQFLNKTGTVIEFDDAAYDCERPTGYEPCVYLIDFGGTKVWVEDSSYAGYNERKDQDIFEKHLNLHN